MSVPCSENGLQKSSAGTPHMGMFTYAQRTAARRQLRDLCDGAIAGLKNASSRWKRTPATLARQRWAQILRLKAAHTVAGPCALQMGRATVCRNHKPVAGQCGPALDDAAVTPDQLPIPLHLRLKASRKPSVDEQLDTQGAHCSVTKQVAIEPDATTYQAFMVPQALVPPAGVLALNDSDRNDEVDELKCDSHGGPPRRRYCNQLARERRPCCAGRQFGTLVQSNSRHDPLAWSTSSLHFATMRFSHYGEEGP